MPQIRVNANADLCPEGITIEAPTGMSICDALLQNNIDIEHACEKSCACTTCHVIVREGLLSLAEAEEEEEDLLDRAWGLEPQSRLSCQAIIQDKDLTIEIPRYTINHAKENH
ncbi:MAG: ISC system 2Fe-2S type ferredoxin [Proteobacteria bacterium]|nr:ISC system 2Fe-2S type ferredoxin [Pseudomonadota bacterium]